MTKQLLFTLTLLLPFFCEAQDWADLPIPADPGEGKVWALQKDFSNDFSSSGKSDDFHANWKDTYWNKWTGPGLTHWMQEESDIAKGQLIISASRRAGTDKVNCGVVTSKGTVLYPLYTEARIKVSQLELSSNFWLLSTDNRREIDVLEIYGGAANPYFARNMSTNFHVFIRSQEKGISSDFNYQNHVTLPDSAFWRDDYHTFGVYWKSPTEVFFYIDGEQLPAGSWKQAEMFDKDYTRTKMDKTKYQMDRPMHLILDTEDHHWRSVKGIVASDEDLADPAKNKMYVDWIRTYKPVPVD